MRTGDTVAVPTRRTWTRCGMSEPVMKTSCSETFSSRFDIWSAGVPASEEVTDRRNRDAIINNTGVFTATKYTGRVSSAISIILPSRTRSAAEDGGSYNHEFNRSTGFILEGGTRTRLAGLPRANPRTSPSRSIYFWRRPALPLCPRRRLSNKDR
jgi:hypothetical protein